MGTWGVQGGVNYTYVVSTVNDFHEGNQPY